MSSRQGQQVGENEFRKPGEVRVHNEKCGPTKSNVTSLDRMSAELCASDFGIPKSFLATEKASF